MACIFLYDSIGYDPFTTGNQQGIFLLELIKVASKFVFLYIIHKYLF